MGMVGIEPTHYERTDLQSAVPHQLHRIPIAGMINIANYWTMMCLLMLNWSGWQDLNLRPPLSESGRLPG